MPPPSQGTFTGLLVFNGHSLTLYDRQGTPLYSVEAISGKPPFHSPSYQGDMGRGPIPEGLYMITRDQTYFRGLNSWGFPTSPLDFGDDASRNSWGDARARLIPQAGTETYERSGFYLHGGAYAGSLGCIDVLGQENIVLETVRGMVAGGGLVEVRVDYTGYDPQVAQHLIDTYNPATGVSAISHRPPLAQCFVAGTPVLMADGSHKAIEQVEPGDWVAAFGKGADAGRAPLVPARVARTFRNNAWTFSFLNLRTTPGHRFLTGEGKFERLDWIFENDGTVVSQAGAIVRARTGFRLGTPEDGLVRVLYRDRSGQDQEMAMRGGMICDDRMLGTKRALLTICKAMEQRGLWLRDDGLFEAADGSAGPVMWEGIPGDHLELGRHVPFARLLRLHRETTPLMGLVGGRRVPNPMDKALPAQVS